jgi:hypothetical protein
MRFSALVVCCGCSFHSPETGGGGDAGIAGDAPMIDAPNQSKSDAMAAGLCSTGAPILDEHFTSATPCSSWGTSWGPPNTSIAQGGGQLTVTPTQGNSDGGCSWNQAMPLGVGGAVVEANPMSISDGYTTLQLVGIDRQLGKNGDELQFSTVNSTTVFAHAPYDATAMHWWRLRPTTTAIVAEYSADGQSWTMFGSRPTSFQDVQPTLIAGLFGSAVPATGSEFTRFALCP